MSNQLQRQPHIVERPPRPYVGVRGSVAMDAIGPFFDHLPGVFGWLAERGIEPADAPFLRFETIDMERELTVELGIPTAAPVEGDDAVVAGVLPPGRYATVTHIGHPDELLGVTGAFLDWARAEGLSWDVEPSPAGDRWGCRLEIYRTDPAVEPDMSKWETVLEFRLAD